MGLATALVLLFVVALTATLVMPTRWRWIAAVGAAIGVAFWIAQIAGGCDEELEVTCSLQPLVGGLFALMLLAAWLCGVAIGLLVRRLARREPS